jgi:hypothetical protein
MRTALRLLTGRYGIALALLVIVVAIAGGARLVSGPGSGGGLVAGPAAEPPHSSIDPTAGDDSVPTPESPAPPVTSPGAPPPDQVATDFMRAWLRHDGVGAEQWRAGLTRYATAGLLDKLKGVDPAGVPAQRMTGPVSVHSRGATFVEAVVPVDSGSVRLRLLASAGRWLVDGVDWERA